MNHFAKDEFGLKANLACCLRIIAQFVARYADENVCPKDEKQGQEKAAADPAAGLLQESNIAGL